MISNGSVMGFSICERKEQREAMKVSFTHRPALSAHAERRLRVDARWQRRSGAVFGMCSVNLPGMSADKVV